MKHWSVALTVIVVAACASAPEAPDIATSPRESVATPSENVAAPRETATRGEDTGPTPQALDFSASLVGGGQIEGGDLAGRDVALWFWAPW